MVFIWTKWFISFFDPRGIIFLGLKRILEYIGGILHKMSSTFDNNKHLQRVRIFLNLSDKDARISNGVCDSFKDSSDRLKALETISTFVGYFQLFNDLDYLKKEVQECIVGTLEICSNMNELMDSLLKSTLFSILELVLDYSKIKGDKDKVLKTLSTSLEILAPSALIINLGTMAKPVFEDKDYQAKKSQEEQVEVKEIEQSDIAQEIKAKIASWIETQQLSLEQQGELHKQIEQKIAKLAEEKGLEKASKEYQNIIVESKEMVNLKLTAMSLIMDFGDEDLSPQPLSL